MKNVINILLRKLYNQIPKEIMMEAFKPTQQQRTLDACVKEDIIVDFVLVSCNLYAGKVKKITLLEKYLKEVDDGMIMSAVPGDYSVFYIPPEARENRDINVVLDIAYPSSLALNSAYPYSFLSGRSVMNAAEEALSSATHTPAYITPTPILMGNNTIQLSPPMSMHVDYVLSCMLEYDKDFSNISANMVEPLFKCVLYATQSYIYNKLVIQLDQGYLTGGAQLSSIKNIVDGYADAYEKYEEAVTSFRGAATFDKSSMLDMLSLMVGS